MLFYSQTLASQLVVLVSVKVKKKKKKKKKKKDTSTYLNPFLHVACCSGECNHKVKTDARVWDRLTLKFIRRVQREKSMFVTGSSKQHSHVEKTVT